MHLFFSYLIDNTTEHIIEKCGEIEICLLTLLMSSVQLTFPFPFFLSSSGYFHSQQIMPLLIVKTFNSESNSLGTLMKFIGHLFHVENVHSSSNYFIMELVSNSHEKSSVCVLFYKKFLQLFRFYCIVAKMLILIIQNGESLLFQLIFFLICLNGRFKFRVLNFVIIREIYY